MTLNNPIIIIVISVLSFPLLIYLFKYPEISFALFLNSYVIKGGYLIHKYFDLTIFLLVITLVGFYLHSLHNKPKIKIKPNDYFLWGFLIVMLFGSMYAPDIYGGLIKSIRFFVFVFVPYIIARLYFTSKYSINLLIATIHISAFITGVIYIIMALLSGDLTGRIPFFEANLIPVSTLFTVGFVISIIEIANPYEKDNVILKVLNLFMSTIFLYAIFLSGIRGQFYSAVFTLMMLFLYYIVVHKRIISGFKLAIIGACMFVTFSLLYHINVAPTFYAYTINAIVSGASYFIRIDLFNLALSYINNSPLIGIGTSGFPGYPHNMFLEVTVENGIIGLVFYLAFIITVAWFGYKFILVDFKKIDSATLRKNSIIIITVGLTLFLGRQMSYSLDMHKDLFVFLALIVNFPEIIKHEI